MSSKGLRALGGALTALLSIGCSGGADRFDSLERSPGRRTSTAEEQSAAGASRTQEVTGHPIAFAPWPEDPTNRVLATVDGQAVRQSDLVDAMMFFARETTREVLRKVVEDRMVKRDAARLGVRVPRPSLARAVDDAFAQVKREVEERGATGMTLTRYLSEELRTTEAQYRETLAYYVHLSALRDRVVRYSLMREERLVVRGFVVEGSIELANRIARDLREGADFAFLLQRFAPDAKARPDGLWAPIPVSFRHPLADAFRGVDAKSGFLAPIAFPRGDASLFFIAELVERLPKEGRAYDQVARAVEGSLAERPVERDEYLFWVRDASGRYPVGTGTRAKATGGL